MKKFFSLLYSISLFLLLLVSSCTNQTAISKEVSTSDTLENSVAPTNVNSKGVFSWYYGLCEYEGIYDSKKYTHQELQNLLDISTMGILLQTSATVSDYTKANTLSLEDLDKEYNEKKEYFTSLKLPTNYNHLKKERLDELEMEYRFKRIAIEAYQNPKVLENSPVDCQKYANAIIVQNQSTIQACREMIEERVKSGSYEKSSLDDFEEEAKTPQALNYATTQLVTYGWWNCVNATIPRDESEKMYTQFKSLFEKITEECDEP